MIFDEEEKEALLNDRKNLAKFDRDIKRLIGLKKNETIEEFKNEYVRLHCVLSKEELLHRLEIIDELIDFIKR